MSENEQHRSTCLLCSLEDSAAGQPFPGSETVLAYRDDTLIALLHPGLSGALLAPRAHVSGFAGLMGGAASFLAAMRRMVTAEQSLYGASGAVVEPTDTLSGAAGHVCYHILPTLPAALDAQDHVSRRPVDFATEVLGVAEALGSAGDADPPSSQEALVRWLDGVALSLNNQESFDQVASLIQPATRHAASELAAQSIAMAGAAGALAGSSASRRGAHGTRRITSGPFLAALGVAATVIISLLLVLNLLPTASPVHRSALGGHRTPSGSSTAGLSPIPPVSSGEPEVAPTPSAVPPSSVGVAASTPAEQPAQTPNVTVIAATVSLASISTPSSPVSTTSPAPTSTPVQAPAPTSTPVQAPAPTSTPQALTQTPQVTPSSLRAQTTSFASADRATPSSLRAQTTSFASADRTTPSSLRAQTTSFASADRTTPSTGLPDDNRGAAVDPGGQGAPSGAPCPQYRNDQSGADSAGPSGGHVKNWSDSH
jgi:hypothetical protein